MKICFSASLALAVAASPASADTIVAARTIRAQELLGPADLRLENGNVEGAFDRLADVVGQESRVAIYAGRPIRFNEVGPPAIVKRNQIVTLAYLAHGLTIATEGRALGRAGVGDRLRVMNLTSKTTVTGVVRSNGTVIVGPPNLNRLDSLTN